MERGKVGDSRLLSWVIRESEIAASGEGLVGRREVEGLVCGMKGNFGC